MVRTIRRLLAFARPWRASLAVTVVSLLLASAMSLATPAAVRAITALLTEPGDAAGRTLPTLVAALALAFAVRAACRFLSMWQAHVAAWNYVPALTLRVYDHIQTLTPAWFGRRQTGETMSRVLNDTRALEVLIAHTLPDLVSNLAVVLGVAVMIFLINPLLAAIALAPVPLVLYASTFYAKRVGPLYRVNQRVLGKLSGRVQDRIVGMKEIQAFRAEAREREDMARACEEYRDVNIRANFANGIYNPGVELLTSLGTVLVAGLGGALALRGRLSAADIVGFFMYLSLFYAPLTTLARLAEDVQTAFAAGERVLGVLDDEPDVKEAPNAVDIGVGRGELTFEHVTFSYGGAEAPVLRDLSFTARPGGMTAIVGATGAGKTTIASLIERFYDVTDGRVLLDGRDVRTLKLDCLRRNMSAVLQDAFLFNGTILENIRYGAPSATDARVIEAAKAARAHEFIEALPDGYQTLVGERGARLSGGQKQRVAIARALLLEAPILILDEATSAVDNETEERIRESMEELRGQKTLIVIAHRLSTIRRADSILVLENGEVAQSGTHEELIKTGGLYSRLYRAQADRLP